MAAESLSSFSSSAGGDGRNIDELMSMAKSMASFSFLYSCCVGVRQGLKYAMERTASSSSPSPSSPSSAARARSLLSGGGMMVSTGLFVCTVRQWGERMMSKRPHQDAYWTRLHVTR